MPCVCPIDLFQPPQPGKGGLGLEEGQGGREGGFEMKKRKEVKYM